MYLPDRDRRSRRSARDPSLRHLRELPTRAQAPGAVLIQRIHPPGSCCLSSVATYALPARTVKVAIGSLWLHGGIGGQTPYERLVEKARVGTMRLAEDLVLTGNETAL